MFCYLLLSGAQRNDDDDFCKQKKTKQKNPAQHQCQKKKSLKKSHAKNTDVSLDI